MDRSIYRQTYRTVKKPKAMLGSTFSRREYAICDLVVKLRRVERQGVLFRTVRYDWRMALRLRVCSWLIRRPYWLAAFGIVAITTIWLALHYKPVWYVPVSLSEAAALQARKEVASAYENVTLKIIEKSSFEVTLDEHTVTKWLAVLPTLWPEAREALPPEMSEPAVGFQEGRIYLGAHYRRKWWRTIVNLSVAVSLSNDGRFVVVTLEDVRCGLIPVWRTWLRKWLPKESLRGHGVPNPGAIASGAQQYQSLPAESGSDLFSGLKIENRFVWLNGERPFRLRSIRIEAGKLRLGIEPL